MCDSCTRAHECARVGNCLIAAGHRTEAPRTSMDAVAWQRYIEAPCCRRGRPPRASSHLELSLCVRGVPLRAGAGQMPRPWPFPSTHASLLTWGPESALGRCPSPLVCVGQIAPRATHLPHHSRILCFRVRAQLLAARNDALHASLVRATAAMRHYPPLWPHVALGRGLDPRHSGHSLPKRRSSCHFLTPCFRPRRSPRHVRSPACGAPRRCTHVVILSSVTPLVTLMHPPKMWVLALLTVIGALTGPADGSPAVVQR